MKQYRSWAQAGAIILLAIFLLSPKPHVPVLATREDPLVYALESTGAKVEELTVNGWAKLPVHDLSDTEMEGVAHRAMSKLGFKAGQYGLVHHRSANHRQVKAEAHSDHTYAVAVVQVLYPSWEKQGHEVYMVVNIDKIKPNGSTEVQDTIAKIMQASEGSARVNTCLVGWLDGKLEEEKKLAMLNTAFKAVDASILSSLSYPNMASYTGFTPLIRETLTVGQDRVNINMAIRYSQYENRTYIIVGSPIITREY